MTGYKDLFVPKRVRYDVFTGTCYESSHDNNLAAREAAEKAAAYRKMPARVVITQPMPDGSFRISPPTPGGTWGGQCGSSQWLNDPRLVIHQDSRFQDHWGAMLLAWYENSRDPNKPEDRWTLGPTPGYRVYCERGHRHLGRCGLDRDNHPLLDLTWNGWESIQYEPMELALEV